MTRDKLKSYQANKRLIERNKKKIEDEQCRDIPVVMGKVTGSSRDFPYIERRFAVQMNEPMETDKANQRILGWRQEIIQAEKDMEEVERFIAKIEDVRDREVLTYRYIDGMKTTEIAGKIGYTKGRVSQIISNILKD